MRNWALTVLCVLSGLLLAGCPKGGSDYKQGRQAEALQDYDTALEHYQKALKQDPSNTEYKIKVNRMRFESGQFHVDKGQKLREKGELQLALAEFQRAMAIDPSSPIAEQEARQTLELIGAKAREAEAAAAPPKEAEAPLASAPPELKPLSRAPINLKMANDARIVFETIGKLAGLTVIFDPDFPARRITTELTNVTLEQALDIVSLQSKSFWKPVTENIIFIIPDQPQKRRDYEEQVVKTFYMSNTVQPQELTEIVTGLRQLLDLKRVQQLNAQNAIIVRDTPDKIALADKLIHDIDKAKPEVVIQVEVLQARRDRLRDLGILPGGSATLTFTPQGTTSTTNGSTTTTQSLSLDRLKNLSTKDYSITLPGATANFILTDNNTKIIQNPEIRAIDGQPAKLRVGDRVPVATGSFQAGVGVGATGATGFVNPLVNTQFQYIDVGVNVDITPRVHPNREISMKVTVEVSSVTGTSTIGGIQQPIISQRKLEHDVRLKEGEVNVLGGLIDRTVTKNVSGWPGLSQLPLLRYLFSSEHAETQENEVLIVLIPHIVRVPEWTRANLRPLSAGTETNVQVRRESSIEAPKEAAPAAPSPAAQPPAGAQPGAAPPAQAEAPAGAARIRFDPPSAAVKAGQTVTISVIVDDVKDLFSIPMLLQYNPAVISIEEVRYGGFLSGGTQEVAIVQRVDKERGQAIISATRQPNTPGVNGSGTLMGLVIKGVAPGTSNLSVVQVNARDSQQRPIPLVSTEATFRVEP
jgi:general secretion pathway protein D